MKMSKGVGVLPVLILLIIIGALGYSGWYVWDKHKTSGSLNSSSNTNTSSSTNAEADNEGISSVLKVATFPGANISFQYPSNWDIHNSSYASSFGAPYETYTFYLKSLFNKSNLQLAMSITYDKRPAAVEHCGSYCSVKNIDDITINSKNEKLIESSSNEYCSTSHACSNSADYDDKIYQMFITDDESVEVGQSNIKSQVGLDTGHITGYATYWQRANSKTDHAYLLSPDEFNAQPETDAAKKVLESITY